MHRGYIKIWRKMFDSGIQKEHATFTLWIWILCNVTRKEFTYTIRGQQIILEPGELVFGRNRLAEEMGLTSQNVRTCLKNLRKWKNITIRSTNRFSILKVTNWESYQELETQINQQTNQELTSNQPATNQLPTTKQEDKNVKNVKNKYMVARRRQIPPDFILSEKLIQFAKEHGINGNRINDVFEHFKEHHQSRGTTMLDWDKAFMTWVRNDKKFGAKNSFEKKRPPADLLKWGSSDSTR